MSDNIDQSKFLLICTILQVGNPLLDFSIDLNWPYEYYWSHGLISDDIYQLVTKVCNGSAQIMRGIINQEGSESACIAVTLQIKELTDTIDPFDITGDICLSPVKSHMYMLYKAFLSKFRTLPPLNSKLDALSQQLKFLLALSKLLYNATCFC